MTHCGTNGVRILCMSLALLLGAQGCSASAQTHCMKTGDCLHQTWPPQQTKWVSEKGAWEDVKESSGAMRAILWLTWPIWVPIIVIAVLSKPHYTPTPGHLAPLSDHLRTLSEPAIPPMQGTEPVLSEEATAEEEKPRP
jgi:hypothetical protein